MSLAPNVANRGGEFIDSEGKEEGVRFGSALAVLGPDDQIQAR